MQERSLVEEHAPRGMVRSLKRWMNKIFRSLNSTKMDKSPNSLCMTAVAPMKMVGLLLTAAIIWFLLVGTLGPAIALSFRLPEQEKDFIEVVDETEKPEWRMILKGNLTLKTPDETGVKDLYQLTISFPPKIKHPFEKLSGGAYGGQGMFLASGLPGTIMVAVEEEKAFFGPDRKLFFKEMAKGETSGRTYGLTDIEKKYPEQKKYGVPYQALPSQSILDDFFDALKVTGSFLVGLSPAGPYLGFVQMLTAFKDVEGKNVVYTTSFKDLKDAGKPGSDPLPVFYDDKHYDIQIMSWEKFKDAAGVGHEINYFFELRRKVPDETFLYIRALIPYRWIRGKGEGSYVGGPIDVRKRYIELEWPLKLPAVEKVPPERERYKLITWWATWEEAKADCEKRGGHLVTIDSDDENKVVTQLLKDSGYPHAWIGLSLSDKGKWEWVTLEDVTDLFYEHWGKDPKQPSGGEYYVDIRSDGTWNDWCKDPKNKDYKMPYVCEFESIQAVTVAIDEFRLVGRDDDKVSPWTMEANVQNDAHFKLKMNLASQKKIKSIRVDADFKTTGGYGIWTTGGATYWLLGVFDKGKAVHKGKTSSLGTYKGSLDLDLYGDSYPNVFAKGDEYKVTINFTDGSSITKSFLSTSGVQPEPPKGKAKLVLASAFDDGKNDLSHYRLHIKLNGQLIYSGCPGIGTPPKVVHGERNKETKNFDNFKNLEISFDKSLLRQDNKLEVRLSGVDDQDWFCWDRLFVDDIEMTPPVQRFQLYSDTSVDLVYGGESYTAWFTFKQE